MNDLPTIIIHPQTKHEFFLYCGVIRRHAIDIKKIVLFCREDFIETVRFMYKDIGNIKVHPLETTKACKHDVLYVFNLINKEFKNCVAIGYGFYDRLRKDKYKNTSQNCVNATMRELLLKYDWEESVLKEFSFTRCLFEESKLTKLFASYLNISYIIVSDDKFFKIPTDCSKINILKLFPKNNNIFNYIELISKSDGIIVGNDVIACLLYTLQTCTNIILPRKKVKFYYNENEDTSMFSSPVLPSWTWIKQ